MGGVVSVLIAVALQLAAWLVPGHKIELSPTVFWLIAAGCLFYAVTRAWHDEYRVRSGLEERVAPRLSLLFGDREPPFFEKQHVLGDVDHVFRIAVRNDSLSDVSGIRVVLESCNHPAAQGIHLEHKLQVMGASYGTDVATIAPGQRAMFDVVSDVLSSSGESRLLVRYAADVSRELDRSVVWRLDLRAEGAGPVAKLTFLVRDDGSGRIEMIRTVA